MADIKVGALLSLKDNFSKEIKSAGACTQNFASTAMSAVSKVDKAFSGFKSKLGALGVSLSLGAAGNQIVDIDAKMMRLGVQADVSNKKVNELKNKIYETALAPDIKIGTDELTAALDSVIERTGDLDFAEGNLRAMGLAIQATGASGQDIGGLFAEFQKMGLGASEALKALDTLTVQGKQGAFTLQNLSSLGPRTISAYTATGRSGADALREMGAALQVIRMGTGSSEQAATAFEAVMRNITSPDKQEKLEKLGVKVKDQSGNFKSIVDIMQEIVEESDGSTEILGQVFDAEAMRAFNFAIGEYKRTGAVTSLKKFNDIMGDGATIQKDSARNAGTMAANLKNLQTSFLKFADTNLAKPLERLNDLLQYLSEKPERLTTVFTVIKKGLASIVAIKGVAKVANLVGSISSGLKNFQAGKMEIGFGGGAANGMPVFVTNMGQGGMGAAGGFDMKKNASGGAKQTLGGIMEANSKTFKSGAIQAGALMVITTAVSKTLGAADAIRDINANKNLTDNEKSKAKGGAVGDAVGTVIGTGAGVAAGAWAAGAAGAKLGAMLGTVIAPGIGTAIGGVLGMAGGAIGGFFAGKAGKWIGEKVGGLFGKKDKVIPNSTAVKEEFDQVKKLQAGPQTAKLEGQAGIDFNMHLYDERTEITSTVRHNTAPFAFNTGRVVEARGAY